MEDVTTQTNRRFKTDYTQNAKIAQVTEKSLVIGADAGSGTHYARAFNWRGQELSKKVFSFGNDLAGYLAFTGWLEGYRQSMDAEKVMVGCEPTGHYWFNFARYVKQSGMTLVLVNPYHVKQTKELDDNSPTKNDRKDPKTIAKLVLETAPYPADILALGAEGVNQIWRGHKLRAVGMKRAKALVEAAQKSVGMDGGICARLDLQMLLEDFRRKHEYLKQITEVLEAETLKVPHVEKLLGLELRENSSGKHKGRSSISKRGRKNLRKLLFRAVLPLIRSNDEFREVYRYYTTRQMNPLKGKQAVVAVGCKLIRVFYAILTRGVDYDANRLRSDIVRPREQQAA